MRFHNPQLLFSTDKNVSRFPFKFWAIRLLGLSLCVCRICILCWENYLVGNKARKTTYIQKNRLKLQTLRCLKASLFYEMELPSRDGI